MAEEKTVSIPGETKKLNSREDGKVAVNMRGLIGMTVEDADGFSLPINFLIKAHPTTAW